MEEGEGGELDAGVGGRGRCNKTPRREEGPKVVLHSRIVSQEPLIYLLAARGRGGNCCPSLEEAGCETLCLFLSFF